MAIANLLGVYVKPLLFGIPYTWLCNQPHLFSFQTKILGFLLLQLSFGNEDVHHMEHYAFLLILTSLIPKD
jgi:hypothetical protein